MSSLVLKALTSRLLAPCSCVMAFFSLRQSPSRLVCNLSLGATEVRLCQHSARRAPYAGVQWKVYLPAGPVDTWPLAEEPYKRNVAAAADVPEDWVSILEAPNTSFSVTTQVCSLLKGAEIKNALAAMMPFTQ